MDDDHSRLLKHCYKTMDGLAPSPHPTDRLLLLVAVQPTVRPLARGLHRMTVRGLLLGYFGPWEPQPRGGGRLPPLSRCLGHGVLEPLHLCGQFQNRRSR